MLKTEQPANASSGMKSARIFTRSRTTVPLGETLEEIQSSFASLMSPETDLNTAEEFIDSLEAAACEIYRRHGLPDLPGMYRRIPKQNWEYYTSGPDLQWPGGRDRYDVSRMDSFGENADLNSEMGIAYAILVEIRQAHILVSGAASSISAFLLGARLAQLTEIHRTNFRLGATIVRGLDAVRSSKTGREKALKLRRVEADRICQEAGKILDRKPHLGLNAIAAELIAEGVTKRDARSIRRTIKGLFER